MQENDPLGGNAETATRRMRDLKKESDAVASSLTAAFASGKVRAQRIEGELKGIWTGLSESDDTTGVI